MTFIFIFSEASVNKIAFYFVLVGKIYNYNITNQIMTR